MKYNENNKPIVCMQTQSDCYKGTCEMEIKGVLWHSTGCNNPNIKRYVQPSDDAADKDEMISLIGKNQYGNDWNHISRSAGLNAWIGKLEDGTIATVQTMPWNYRPWGCGGGCNSGWIQFEICEDDLTSKEYFEKVYNEACELTAYLCKLYNINPKGTATHNGIVAPTILCHQDSYKLGLGSNHADVYHWFNKYGKTMDDVREDVSKLLQENKVEYIKYSKEDFIKNVAKYVQEIAPKYGIKVASPIVAQAILESAYGTSNKATHNNYFGLKYRKGRLTCHCGTFIDGSSEQLADGTYIPITDQWFEFKTMRDGIEGYFQYTNIDRYKNLKGVTDPYQYLVNIKADGYATSLNYVDNVYKVITNWNLTQYDEKQEEQEKEQEVIKYYRVRKSWNDVGSQIGAYKVLQNAINVCKNGYYVFDNDGNVVYPEVKEETPTTPTQPSNKLKDGDIITLRSGCTYYNGKSIPSWVFGKTLYYRGKNENGIIFSILKTGAITGVVKEADVITNTTKDEYRNYEVKKGDSLWAIAANELGDGKRYKEIKELNNIPSNNIIYAGQVLKLPNR